MFDILTPEVLILAYSNAYFPMAEADGELFWYSPDPRAIIPLESVKISRSLRQTIKKDIFEIRINSAFEEVIRSCAEREETWISEEIIEAYCDLHEVGGAHSVESWHNGELVGGLYGVALGGAFFGESMFSRMTDASKVAYAFLIERLQERRFILLDTQFINSHVERLGAIEIPLNEYKQRLSAALKLRRDFL